MNHDGMFLVAKPVTGKGLLLLGEFYKGGSVEEILSVLSNLYPFRSNSSCIYNCSDFEYLRKRFGITSSLSRVATDPTSPTHRASRSAKKGVAEPHSSAPRSRPKGAGLWPDRGSNGAELRLPLATTAREKTGPARHREAISNSYTVFFQSFPRWFYS